MSNLEFLITLARIAAICIGCVVFVMWLLGCLGLADFRLVFIVPELQP